MVPHFVHSLGLAPQDTELMDDPYTAFPDHHSESKILGNMTYSE